MPIPAIVAALLPTLIEKIFGRKDEMIVDKNGLNDKIVSATKGLIRSKTARFATGALAAKFFAVGVSFASNDAVGALSGDSGGVFREPMATHKNHGGGMTGGCPDG